MPRARAILILAMWSLNTLAGIGPEIETLAPKAPLPSNPKSTLRRLRPLSTWTTQMGPYFSYVGVESEGNAPASGFARGGELDVLFAPEGLAPVALMGRVRVTRVDLGSKSAPPTYEALLGASLNITNRLNVWAGGLRIAGVFAVPGASLLAQPSWGFAGGVVLRTSRRNASGFEFGALVLRSFTDGIGYRLTATGIVPVSSSLGFRVGLEAGQWFWRLESGRQTIVCAGTSLGAAWMF